MQVAVSSWYEPGTSNTSVSIPDGFWILTRPSSNFRYIAATVSRPG